MSKVKLTEKKSGDTISSQDWGTMNQTLCKVSRILDLLPALMRKGDTVTARERSLRIELIKKIYLLQSHDWVTARNLIKECCLVFMDVDISTVPSSELQNIVETMRVIAVALIDTEPYHQSNLPAFYPWFYTIINPYSFSFDYNGVVDPTFIKYLGGSVPTLIDYLTPVNSKVSSVTSWAVYVPDPTYSWSYLKLESEGGVVEVPYDGVWRSATVLESYLRAISEKFWGIDLPSCVIHIAGYTSGQPSWHEQYPFDNCWITLARRIGYTVVDMR